MRLTDQEKEILDGKQGEAARIALSILVDLGELFGAEEMMEVSQVHIDSSMYIVDAGLEFAERMVELGAKMVVPTSLNPSAIDLERWRQYRVPPGLLRKSKRMERAYVKMGATPTWTCAPYQQGMVPRFGEQIAWGESNAIAFANSIIGARTNRYGDLMDVCASLVGKVPNFGLHLPVNRKAEVLIRLMDITDEMLEDKAFYPLLGYLLGEMAGDRVAAIEGIPQNVAIDSLKGFSAAAASSWAVGLFSFGWCDPRGPDIRNVPPGYKAQGGAGNRAKNDSQWGEEALDDQGGQSGSRGHGLPSFFLQGVQGVGPAHGGQ